MSLKTRLRWSAPLLLLASGIAQAQEQAQEEGLIEIYERALLNDPIIRAEEANLLAQSEVRAQARSGLLPSLSLSASGSDSHSLNPNPPLDFQTGEPSTVFASSESDSESSGFSLSINQTVFDWSQLLSLKQADKIIARAETDYAAVRQDLLLRTAEAYFAVLAAEDSLAAEIAAREAIEQQLEQAQRRFDVGLIAITDVQQAQAGFDTAVASVIAAQRRLATAQEILREIINDYVTDLKTPIDELPLLTPEPADIDAWVEMAQAQNLALISSRISAEIAGDDIDIARSARFPTLRLSASGQDNTSTATQRTNLFSGGAITEGSQSDREGDSINLSLSLPIYQGGANRSRVRQSVYRQRAAMETVERVSRQVERETRDAYLGVTSEISRVQALRQAVESARTALRATQAALEVGQQTIIDVLTAQNNLTQAETNYASARYEYLLNVLRLKQAAGSLTQEDLVEIDSWLE